MLQREAGANGTSRCFADNLDTVKTSRPSGLANTCALFGNFIFQRFDSRDVPVKAGIAGSSSKTIWGRPSPFENDSSYRSGSCQAIQQSRVIRRCRIKRLPFFVDRRAHDALPTVDNWWRHRRQNREGQRYSQKPVLLYHAFPPVECVAMEVPRTLHGTQPTTIRFQLLRNFSLISHVERVELSRTPGRRDHPVISGENSAFLDAANLTTFKNPSGCPQADVDSKVAVSGVRRAARTSKTREPSKASGTSDFSVADCGIVSSIKRKRRSPPVATCGVDRSSKCAVFGLWLRFSRGADTYVSAASGDLIVLLSESSFRARSTCWPISVAIASRSGSKAATPNRLLNLSHSRDAASPISLCVSSGQEGTYLPNMRHDYGRVTAVQLAVDHSSAENCCWMSLIIRDSVISSVTTGCWSGRALGRTENPLARPSDGSPSRASD